jgi:hypothetical protein
MDHEIRLLWQAIDDLDDSPGTWQGVMTSETIPGCRADVSIAYMDKISGFNWFRWIKRS